MIQVAVVVCLTIVAVGLAALIIEALVEIAYLASQGGLEGSVHEVEWKLWDGNDWEGRS